MDCKYTDCFLPGLSPDPVRPQLTAANDKEQRTVLVIWSVRWKKIY